MKILITGVTGLLGSALLSLLLAKGYEVRCLVREDSPNASRLDSARTEIVGGNTEDVGDLSRALSGMEATVHIAGIEYAPVVLEALHSTGVKRLVVVSSTSVCSAHEFRSGQKRQLEYPIRQSGLEYTIVRPTMIYGSELDKNVHRLLRFLDRSPVFPIFGPGDNLWQPVYHEDCAQGVLEALERPVAMGETYDLPGAEPLAYLVLVRFAAAALGKERRIVRIPLEPVRHTLRVAELARIPLPVRAEQVLRLREDKACPYEKARRELDYTPRSIPDGVRLEVERLREVGMVSP